MLKEAPDLVLRQFRLAAGHSRYQGINPVAADVIPSQVAFGSKVASLQIARPNVTDGLRMLWYLRSLFSESLKWPIRK
jgi:hypothetical protein